MRARREPSDADAELAADLLPRLLKLSYLLRRDMPVLFSPAQSAVLGRLSERPLRVGELARAEGVRVPTMTETVTRLEGQGWIKREALDGDRRAVVVRLTPIGRRLLRDLAIRRRILLRERLARLSAEQRARIAGSLTALDALIEPWPPPPTPPRRQAA
jgi:DNA-binding MarR family transcriptional regulator